MDPTRRQKLLDMFETLASELQETHGFSEEDLLRAIRGGGQSIPATYFDNTLTPFETLVRHLEEQGASIKQTASILKRSPSVIEKTLANSHQKQEEPLTGKETTHHVPISIFADKTLGFSEHLAIYLKSSGMTNAEIARETGYDPRTIWTLLKRAEEKSGGEEQ